MSRDAIAIGDEFTTVEGTRLWRVTDVGTRIVAAIRIDAIERVRLRDGVEERHVIDGVRAEAEGWFRGPPYGVAERVFDEDDLRACEPVPAVLPELTDELARLAIAELRSPRGERKLDALSRGALLAARAGLRPGVRPPRPVAAMLLGTLRAMAAHEAAEGIDARTLAPIRSALPDA